jgi:hypothetical protein
MTNTLPGNLPFAYKTTELANIDPAYRAEFVRELEAGNFMRGGTSLMIVAPEPSKVFEWMACLNLANMPGYCISVHEVTQRMVGGYVLHDSDERKGEFEEAETVFIYDLFTADHDPTKLLLLANYMQQIMQDGVVVLMATDQSDQDMAFLGPMIGTLIEERAEVIHVKTATSKTAAGKRIGKHGGPATSVGNHSGGFRPNAARR